MDNYNSSHGFFRTEFLIVCFAAVLVLFVVSPIVKSFYSKIEFNSAIGSLYSYKENFDSFFVSKMLSDSSFRLNGTYIISSGSISSGDEVYDILTGGNTDIGGYLDYSDNHLTDGCIDVSGYSIIIENGVISSIKGECNIPSFVAMVD